MQAVIITLYRTIAAYFLLLILTRLMGRKMLSQLTFFDFVVGVTVGEMAALLSVGKDHSTLTVVSSLIAISLLTIIVDFAHIKSYVMRKLINSKPMTLIENGQIVEENMKKTRFAIDDLMMELRKKNIFNIADVEFAIIEISGEISVLPKAETQPATRLDLGIPAGKSGLTKNIIIDGNVMEFNLKKENRDKQWLMNELHSYGIESAEEVFYAGLDSSGNLYVSKKGIKKNPNT